MLVRSKGADRGRTLSGRFSRRGESRTAAAHRVEAPRTPRLAEVEPGRPEGRPLAHDHALYPCCCGYVFEAPVSTSVACPHCGDTQAW